MVRATSVATGNVAYLITLQISRFRRPDKSIPRASASTGEEEIEGEKFSLHPSNTTRSDLSAFDLPLRYGRSQDSDSKRKDRSRDRRADPLGLTILHEPESSPSADIVFVHGLGGTSRHTWSKNRDLQLFWPLEWLPYEPELTSARIMTFGYNSHFCITQKGEYSQHLRFCKGFAIQPEICNRRRRAQARHRISTNHLCCSLYGRSDCEESFHSRPA